MVQNFSLEKSLCYAMKPPFASEWFTRTMRVRRTKWDASKFSSLRGREWEDWR